MFTKGPTCGSDSKESACKVGDPGSVPGSGRSPGEGNDDPLQYCCLENSMNRGAWWDTVHIGSQRVKRQLSNYTFTFQRANCISISLQIKGQTGENIGRNIGENKGRHNSQYNGLRTFSFSH